MGAPVGYRVLGFVNMARELLRQIALISSTGHSPLIHKPFHSCSAPRPILRIELGRLSPGARVAYCMQQLGGERCGARRMSLGQLARIAGARDKRPRTMLRYLLGQSQESLEYSHCMT